MSFELPKVEYGSDLDELFRSVGFVVVQWGYAEQSLDLMAASIFHFSKDHSLLKRRPKQLERKVEFLTECFASIPILRPLQPEADALLTTFLRIGKVRNDLVHSAIGDFSLRDGAFMFLKIDVVPGASHNFRQVFFAESEWPSLRKELLHLGKESQSLARKVQNALL